MKTRTVAVLVMACAGILATVIPILLARKGAEAKPLLPDNVVWLIRYDYVLDGVLRGEVSESRWRFEVHDNHITGTPISDKEGNPEEQHRITGEVVDGRVPLLSLRQAGLTGYVCFTSGRRVGAERFAGTWYDNAGWAGDFEMMRDNK
jgi:hypothetical protein